MVVVFLGPALEEAIAYMAATGRGLFLVLHYTPSVLALQHQLVPVMFPVCRCSPFPLSPQAGHWPGTLSSNSF